MDLKKLTMFFKYLHKNAVMLPHEMLHKNELSPPLLLDLLRFPKVDIPNVLARQTAKVGVVVLIISPALIFLPRFSRNVHQLVYEVSPLKNRVIIKRNVFKYKYLSEFISNYLKLKIIYILKYITVQPYYNNYI